MRKQRGIATIIISVVFFPVWFPCWAFCVAVTAQSDRTRAFSRRLHERFAQYRYGGFTLIELSIVLVIIGLIVGGVLVGQDLIKAAQVRATISQLEKYNTAVNTFRDKYGGLPGDLNAAAAAQFGFVARAGTVGRGDGNGIIEGFNYEEDSATGDVQTGETGLMWVDLSTAKLIDQGFTQLTDSWTGGSITDLTPYLPVAKLGNGNFIYIYSREQNCAGNNCPTLGTDYFGMSVITSMNNQGVINSQPGLTVKQAYDIDKKVDDGLPTSGRVTAAYVNSWGASQGGYTLSGNAASPSSTTCYDTTSGAYSLTQNNGNGVNCGLSFRMQAGD